MTTKEIIEDFFEEQFQNTSQFFLYKDKQLLNNEKYQEYAREQLKKANKIFWSVAFGIFICSFYSISNLIEYGSQPNWFDLALGLASWITLVIALLLATKEYYTIKSSMSLLIKLLQKDEKNQTRDITEKTSIT